MKRLPFLFLFITAFLFSQKIEIKNGKVFIDETAVAKIRNTGAEFIYASLEDIPRFKVQVIKLNPVKSILRITDIEGEKSNDIENKIYSATFSREKKITENLLFGEFPLINKEGIDEKELANFFKQEHSELITDYQNKKKEKEQITIKNDQIYIEGIKVASLRFSDWNVASGNSVRGLIYTDLNGNDALIIEENKHSIKISDLKGEKSNEIKKISKAFNYKKRLTENLILGKIKFIDKNGINKVVLEDFFRSKQRDFNQDHINSSVAQYNLYIDNKGNVYAGGVKNNKEGKPYIDNTKVGKIERKIEGNLLSYDIKNEKDTLVAFWKEKINTGEKEVLQTKYKSLYNRKYTVRYLPHFYPAEIYELSKDTLALNILKTLYFNDYKLGEYVKYEYKEITDEEIKKLNLYIDNKGLIYAGGEPKKQYKKGENLYIENTNIGKIIRTISKTGKAKYVIANAEGQEIAVWNQEKTSESGIPLLITNERIMYFPYEKKQEKKGLEEDLLALDLVKKLYKNSITLSPYEKDDEFIKRFNLSINDEGEILAGSKVKNKKPVGKIIKQLYKSDSGKELYTYEIKDNKGTSVAKWLEGELTLFNEKRYPLPYINNTQEVSLSKDPMAMQVVEKLFKNEIILKNTDPSLVESFFNVGFSILFIGLKIAK